MDPVYSNFTPYYEPSFKYTPNWTGGPLFGGSEYIAGYTQNGWGQDIPIIKQRAPTQAMQAVTQAQAQTATATPAPVQASATPSYQSIQARTRTGAEVADRATFAKQARGFNSLQISRSGIGLNVPE